MVTAFLLVGALLAMMFIAARAFRVDEGDGRRPDSPTVTRSRITLAATIAVVTVASVGFRWISGYGLQQSAALFVGIPALLAIAAVFSPTPRTATGVACKAVSIGLLVSLIFLGEGMLCILMSAPIFYGIAIVVGLAVDYLRRDSRKRGGTMISCVALLAMIPMCLEGVTAGTSFAREASASETRIVHASAGAVERAVFELPRFDRVLPAYLRAGFPRPTSVHIDRDTWVIRMRGGETRLDGMEPREGVLVLIMDARPGAVQWNATSDDSHMTHFLLWRSARVEWQAIDATTTRVTWTLRYRRGLDPAWYFGPMEQYAARLAAGYLIDTVATP
jgi:hypothetical protein